MRHPLLTYPLACPPRAPAGRILNIALSPADAREPPRLLNYLTAPHVVVWSAAAPCCAALGGGSAAGGHELLARSASGELIRYGDSMVVCVCV